MSKTLTNHEEIKNWADKNDMKPATVRDTNESNDTSLLRFTSGDEENLHDINWEHFFELFEQNKLALIVEDDSKFNKFISRRTMRKGTKKFVQNWLLRAIAAFAIEAGRQYLKKHKRKT